MSAMPRAATRRWIEIPSGEISVIEHFATIHIPKHTFGMCKRAKKFCRNFAVDLGDDHCVECWDKGHPLPSSQRRKWEADDRLEQRRTSNRLYTGKNAKELHINDRGI